MKNSICGYKNIAYIKNENSNVVQMVDVKSNKIQKVDLKAKFEKNHDLKFIDCSRRCLFASFGNDQLYVYSLNLQAEIKLITDNFSVQSLNFNVRKQELYCSSYKKLSQNMIVFDVKEIKNIQFSVIELDNYDRMTRYYSFINSIDKFILAENKIVIKDMSKEFIDLNEFNQSVIDKKLEKEAKKKAEKEKKEREEAEKMRQIQAENQRQQRLAVERGVQRIQNIQNIKERQERLAAEKEAQRIRQIQIDREYAQAYEERLQREEAERIRRQQAYIEQQKADREKREREEALREQQRIRQIQIDKEKAQAEKEKREREEALRQQQLQIQRQKEEERKQLILQKELSWKAAKLKGNMTDEQKQDENDYWERVRKAEIYQKEQKKRQLEAQKLAQQQNIAQNHSQPGQKKEDCTLI